MVLCICKVVRRTSFLSRQSDANASFLFDADTGADRFSQALKVLKESVDIYEFELFSVESNILLLLTIMASRGQKRVAADMLWQNLMSTINMCVAAIRAWMMTPVH